MSDSEDAGGTCSDGTERIVIESTGEFDWQLTINSGEVRAAKPIPYDGIKVVTTEQNRHPSRTARRHGSEFGLSANEVVEKYARYSDSTTPIGELQTLVDRSLRSDT